MKKQKIYDSIVKKAQSYINSNLPQSISVSKISAHVGYSSEHVRRAFRAILSESVLLHIHRMRMEKAKQLLENTTIPITEIAFDVGFNSYTRFAVAFRKRTGQTPSSFRTGAKKGGSQSAGATTETSINRKWFSDSFSGTNLGLWWHPLSGEWRQENGMLIGKGFEGTDISFLKSLPENFRISYEVLFTRSQGLEPSDLMFYLRDEEKSGDYCALVIGAHGNVVGELRHFGISKYWNEKAVLKENTWQKVEVELKEDVLRLFLDGEEMFCFRDPFPPPYSARSRLTLGTWKSYVQFRNFEIFDLGFSPFVSAIRRGDALFNQGQFDKAREFYLRLLQTENLSIDTMELRLKIGICYLRERLFGNARAWLEKLAALSETNPWSQQAMLGLLELDWKSGDSAAFSADARRYFFIPAIRHDVREIISMAARDFGNRGFIERGAELRQMLFDLEDRQSLSGILAEQALAANYIICRRFGLAKQHLQHSIFAAQTPKGTALAGRFILMEMYVQSGKHKEATAVIDEIRKVTNDPDDLAHAYAFEGLNLRVQGKFEQAIAYLRDSPKKFPLIPGWNSFALYEATLILTMLGKTEEAKQEIHRLEQLYPDISPGPNEFHYYLPYIVEEDYKKAAEIVIAGLSAPKQNTWRYAEYMIRAGIVSELAGEEKRAAVFWAEAAQRFPPATINFFGNLASQLLKDENDELEQMPAAARFRSEMFYLAGLLYEKRGNKKRAQEIFEFCAKEDLSNRAPAYLSKKKLP